MTTFQKVAQASALAFLLAATPVHATPPSGFVGTVQWQGPFDPMNVKVKTDGIDARLHSKDVANLLVVKFNVAPGGTSGWHTHPGMSLVTVISGEITLYEASLCTARRLTAGQTFVDEGGDHVHLVRNETASPTQLGAVQLVQPGVPGRTDRPRPNNCASGVE
jgi:quercetin dioxygenase-like cupin family protein